MSIDKKGPNRFRFRVQHQGQKYSRIFHGTEREAKKEHEKFKYEVKSDQINKTGEMTLTEFAQVFVDEYVRTLRYTTQKIYLNNFNNHILPVLGGYKLKNISPLMIQKLVNELNKTLSPLSVRSAYANLARAFHFAVKWEKAEKNPCVQTTLPKVQKTNMEELYSIEDIKRLVAVYEKESNSMHKAAFFLALGCGLRNSEIRALTISDIDFKANTISVNKQMSMIKNDQGKERDKPMDPKTDSSKRKIFMPVFVSEVLKEHIRTMQYIPITKYLFFSHVTKVPVTKHALSKRFKNVLENNNLPNLRFHDLRHLHATLLIHAGANVQATAKRLGHSSVNTTIQVYIHSMEDMDKLTSELINEKYASLLLK